MDTKDTNPDPTIRCFKLQFTLPSKGPTLRFMQVEGSLVSIGSGAVDLVRVLHRSVRAGHCAIQMVDGRMVVRAKDVSDIKANPQSGPTSEDRRVVDSEAFDLPVTLVLGEMRVLIETVLLKTGELAAIKALGQWLERPATGSDPALRATVPAAKAAPARPAATPPPEADKGIDPFVPPPAVAGMGPPPPAPLLPGGPKNKADVGESNSENPPKGQTEPVAVVTGGTGPTLTSEMPPANRPRRNTGTDRRAAENRKNLHLVGGALLLVVAFGVTFFKLDSIRTWWNSANVETQSVEAPKATPPDMGGITCTLMGDTSKKVNRSFKPNWKWYRPDEEVPLDVKKWWECPSEPPEVPIEGGRDHRWDDRSQCKICERSDGSDSEE